MRRRFQAGIPSSRFRSERGRRLPPPRQLELLEPRMLLARDVFGPRLASAGMIPVSQHLETTVVTDYFDNRDAAMALSFDTELYLCIVHSLAGYNPRFAASRAQDSRDGWVNVMDDAEAAGIPVNFNTCAFEMVFGDSGPSEYAELDITYDWHPDSHWAENTWYSDAPQQGGNYKTVGELSGTVRGYDLVYGGDLAERAMNSVVPFETSYHNFGHESLPDMDAETMDAAFRLGVEYHRSVGSKVMTQAPPWNHAPHPSTLPIYGQNGMFALSRLENKTGVPNEIIEDLWIVPRNKVFHVDTDLTSDIDAAIAAGHVLSPYSHPEDGFERSERSAFQDSLAYAKQKVESGELWATTVAEIARYWEAKSNVSVQTQMEDGKTIVDISLQDYDVSTFGIPYLTLVSPMPNDSAHAKVAVNYPTPQVLNSASETVRVEEQSVIYSVYLNPLETTRIEIEGVVSPFAEGVDINLPELSVESEAPENRLEATPIVIPAVTRSTDEIYSVNLIYQRNDDAKAAATLESVPTQPDLWLTSIGPFDAGDRITYYVTVTDNSGRRERSADVTFTVGADETPPEWRSAAQSSDVVVQGLPIELTAEGWDDVGLRDARLETDETGIWEERPEYGSPIQTGDVARDWLSTTFQWENAEISGGTTVSWRIRYTDVAGNATVTDAMSFLVQSKAEVSPKYSEPDFQLKRFDEPATFSLRWTDDTELAGYVFSVDDGSGTFVDEPFMPFSDAERIGEPWWDESWGFRREVTVDNTVNSEELADHAVLVVVDTANLIAQGKLNPHAADLRFVDDAQELDYWIESGLNTDSTRVWVNVPSIPAQSSKQIMMYYGNENRTVPRGNGAETFTLFDDFGGRGWEEFKFSGNPIKGPGQPAGPGTFSSVLRESDGTWKMYSSFDLDRFDIGLSVSEDGITWDRVGAVLRKGTGGEWDWENHWAPVVWKEGDTYYMLRSAFGPGGIQMGLATSPDGVTWTKYDDPTTTEAPYAESDPVFNDPHWATNDTESPCFSVLKEDDTYYVMYDTLRSPRRSSSVAKSTDLIHWTPVDDEPRFLGGPTVSSWNYNIFCGNVFEFEDQYYLVIPGQDISRNHAKFGLYVSDSPEFPQETTEFKGIVMVGEADGWEAEDMDTPWAVMFDNKMHLYYAACGICHSQTGLAIIDDIGLALSQAYPPGNYIGTDRGITRSQRIMPPVGWSKSIPGFEEVSSLNFEITIDSAMTGRAAVLSDLNPENALHMTRGLEPATQGVVSAWMQSSNTETGDFDLYIYGDEQTKLAMVAGLGGNGEFHYWNGSFVDTGVSYQPETWYRIELAFDAAEDTYDFTVYDASFAELVRVEDIDFGNSVEEAIDFVRLRTSDSFNGKAYVDDVTVRSSRLRPATLVGSEATSLLTDARARADVLLPFRMRGAYRWQVTAVDVDGNESASEVFSIPFGPVPILDAPPTLRVDGPTDGHQSNASTVTFQATCFDERQVSQVALFGEWNGGAEPVLIMDQEGMNGQELAFEVDVPNGGWEWHLECTDSAGQTVSGPTRTLSVDAALPGAAAPLVGQLLAATMQTPQEPPPPRPVAQAAQEATPASPAVQQIDAQALPPSTANQRAVELLAWLHGPSRSMETLTRIAESNRETFASLDDDEEIPTPKL